MKAVSKVTKLRFAFSALAVFALAGAGASAANAQSNRSQNDAARAELQIPLDRPVGVEGRLAQTLWGTGSEKDLYDMRLINEVRRLARVPGAMRNTKVWTTRADVSALAGEEILIQIRSPLTCGSLGCEMIVLSEASGSPLVLLRTIGDTIDAPRMDELVVNRGSNRERAWRLRSNRFQQMDKR
ncbi:hypothetical protein PUV54_03150 [Hyphococcus flavus]|uniref:Uncharacterized protein n=1 Tax=Hyphococcus flavus TaxID=1866326 RepID=A0AAF0CGH5_9PROT|nr:hypothetical protein [Hyphococcus flavus]WDI32188.1 hypothetical protein PUV54_03150 [Hyphococcus flavus]